MTNGGKKLRGANKAPQQSKPPKQSGPAYPVTDMDLWNRVKKTAIPLNDRDAFFSEFLHALGTEQIQNGNDWKKSGATKPVKTGKPAKTGNHADAKQPIPRREPTRKPVTLRPIGSGKPTGFTFDQKNSHDRHIDDTTARKIRKGKIPIDATLDLHGMTQIQAHGRLHAFLEQIHREGGKMVLVITGKGPSGEGVLRQAVPRWFSEPGFRNLVSGFRDAHLYHGGTGAIYVRLKRRQPGKN